jgi:hypothetical protein
MIEPIDIWRSAKLMVDQHGQFARRECRRRADELSGYGDEERRSDLGSDRAGRR